MRKYSLNYTAVMSLISCGILANTNPVCQKQAGTTVCGEGELGVAGFNGVVRANGTKITKRLTVKGQALLKNTEINEMKVFGEAVISNTTVLGQSEVYGHLECHQTQFKRRVTLWSNQLSASNSIFEDVIISADQAMGRVVLSEKTTVNGNIVFKGQPGTVSLLSGAKIVGRIINGKQV